VAAPPELVVNHSFGVFTHNRMYNTYTLFKGCTLDALHEAIAYRVHQFQGEVFWDTDERKGLFLGIGTRGDVHTVSFGYRGGKYGFFKGVGKRLQCPWMEARIQESSHWDFSLMHGEEDLGAFSTLPQYYDPSPSARWHFRGNPALLSSLWDVPETRIARYLVNWGDAGYQPEFGLLGGMIRGLYAVLPAAADWLAMSLCRTGKAYPTDEHEYGDYWQLIDFIRALGGDEPPICSPGEMGSYEPKPGGRHRMNFPDNNDIYRYGVVD